MTQISETVRCPISKESCGHEQCVLWVKLSDYEGCPLDIADQAIEDFKINVLLPAALKADSLVKQYLKRQK